MAEALRINRVSKTRGQEDGGKSEKEGEKFDEAYHVTHRLHAEIWITINHFRKVVLCFGFQGSESPSK
jgi:hypothetical protein